MNPSALMIMLTTVVFVTGFTGYFFWKVLHTPSHSDPDDMNLNHILDDSDEGAQ